MNTIYYPAENEWNSLLKRSALKTDAIQETVSSILKQIKDEGDKAVLKFEELFDKVQLSTLQVSSSEFEEAEKEVDEELKAAILLAHRNITTFHAAQKFETKKITTQPGVTCWQKAVGIEKVGLYIPGGLSMMENSVLLFRASLHYCNG